MFRLMTTAIIKLITKIQKEMFTAALMGTDQEM
jgi:hypothetical protein